MADAIKTGSFMESRTGVSVPSPEADGGPGRLELKTLDPRTDASWDREVLAHPGSTIFHCSPWARVLASTYGHRPAYCRISRAGKLVALMPMMDLRSRLSGSRGVCLPFTDFCDPLIFAKSGLTEIGEKIADLALSRKWKYFEVRGNQASPPLATRAIAFYGHSVNLGGTHDLVAGLDGSVRRAIRKAERGALEVRVARSRQAMLDFYGLHVRTRRRHGLPPQPVSFFLNIQEHLVEKGLGFISLVSYGTKAVAAAVFLHQGTKAVFKFGASDRKFQALRPNNLAMWEGMKHLAANGIETVHLGRTSLSNEGLRRFKLGWGAQESIIEYYKFNPVTNTWYTSSDRVAGIHNAVFSHMPLSINRLMGRIIYPHLD